MKIGTERESKIYNAGVKEGIKHCKPSDDTKEFMSEQKANTDVILERIGNLKKTVETQHYENKLQHDDICAKQDHTNGDVKALKLWKAGLLGAGGIITAVVIPMILYFMNIVMDDMEEYRVSNQTTAQDLSALKDVILLNGIEK
jgi:hypothetical protein